MEVKCEYLHTMELQLIIDDPKWETKLLLFKLHIHFWSQNKTHIKIWVTFSFSFDGFHPNIKPNFYFKEKTHQNRYTLYRLVLKYWPVRRKCTPGSRSGTGSGCPGWRLSASSRCSGCGGLPTTRWSYRWWTRILDTWRGQTGQRSDKGHIGRETVIINRVRYQQNHLWNLIWTICVSRKLLTSSCVALDYHFASIHSGDGDGATSCK